MSDQISSRFLNREYPENGKHLCDYQFLCVGQYYKRFNDQFNSIIEALITKYSNICSNKSSVGFKVYDSQKEDLTDCMPATFTCVWLPYIIYMIIVKLCM